jgi:rhodanese-related sulfurtransferase
MSKKMIIAITIFVGFTALTILWSKSTCNASSGSCEGTSQSQTKQSKADLVQLEVLKDTALLIDVREPDEFASGHAENAKNIPLGDIEAGKSVETDKRMKVYVYCRSGIRAAAAKTALQMQGYKNIESIGSLSDWQSLGGKIVK